MGYGSESKGPLFSSIGANGVAPFHAKDVTAVVQVLNPCTIYGVGCLLGANAATNDTTLTITRNIIPGNTTGNVAMAVLTIPSNATVGKIYYANSANFTPQNANAGDELKFVMANLGNTITWVPWIDANPRAETKGNNNDFVPLTPA